MMNGEIAADIVRKEKETSATLIRPRYRQLDSLRGLAALAVFFGHALGGKIDTPLMVFIQKTPLGIMFNGGAAVMFFFVLSGFVLSLPFVGNEKPLKLTAFYVKRIFRIYPALILAIVFALLLREFVYDRAAIIHIPGTPVFSDWRWYDFWNWDWSKEHIKDLVKTLILIGPQFNFNLIDPPIWSLVIEMKISILLPVFIMIIARSSATLNIIFLLIITYLTYDHLGAWSIGVFYSGILIAKYKDDILRTIRSWPFIVVIAAAALGIFLYNNCFEFSSQIQEPDPSFKYIWSKYIMALGSCVIIMIVLAKKSLSRFFEHRFFTFLGNISYSFYLLHMPVLLTVSSLLWNKPAFNGLLIILPSLLVTVMLSYLMFTFIEKPFQKMGAKLISRHKMLSKLSI
jgi:peptidoglycan/LPS O-acetylase OafA/YrhL